MACPPAEAAGREAAAAGGAEAAREGGSLDVRLEIRSPGSAARPPIARAGPTQRPESRADGGGEGRGALLPRGLLRNLDLNLDLDLMARGSAPAALHPAASPRTCPGQEQAPPHSKRDAEAPRDAGGAAVGGGGGRGSGVWKLVSGAWCRR